MTTQHDDPFDALRLPVTPVAPDPRFAAELRARLERALLRGENMSTPAVPTSAPSVGDVSYASLWLPDVRRAEAFYGRLLGWRTAGGDGPGGRFVRDMTPPMGMWATSEVNTLFLAHAVDDVAEAVRRVRAAGGQAGEPERREYGVIADCVDNQGMRFSLSEQPAAGRAALGDPRPGGLVYLTVEVPDSAAFREFYGTVFGWTFTPGRMADGWQVGGVRPMMGMHGGAPRPAVLPMYRVPDIVAAVALVRELGGTAADPAQRPYGVESLCTDDQGSRFYLGQL